MSMLLRRELPVEWARWNAAHASPHGPRWWLSLLRRRWARRVWPNRAALPGAMVRQLGPFAFQRNSDTRTAEYPWTYFTIAPRPGSVVIDVGGGLSGMQFVLARAGCQVTTVDPVLDADPTDSWWFGDADHAALSRKLRAPVRFVRALLQDAGIAEFSADVVTATSVIEHIPAEPAADLMRAIARVLKPGGRLVATVDLFLDVRPFAPAERNRWGTNIDLARLIAGSGLRLEFGDTAELHGFAGFNPAAILARRAEFYEFDGVLSQALVLRKP
ncbi:MAG: SAM-dependent methyltransferase [Planctomyces sp.]|nr:SAM-dependent methyltransferase [Planctomyces sp.]